MILQINNTYSDLEATLKNLTNIHKNIAFVSYVDGEFGCRAWVYNSLVYQFTNALRGKYNDIIIIGFVFKGNTIFVKNSCDIVIELSNTFFEGIECADENETDESINDLELCIKNCNTAKKERYSGKNGWNAAYTFGTTYPEYEKIIKKMNFKNIFYTCHFGGSVFKTSITEGNYENSIFFSIDGQQFGTNIPLIQLRRNHNERVRRRSNKIGIWIRNTNKWPERNLAPSIYNSLFEYCIQNNKQLFIFQDLNEVPVPIHPLLQVCYIRKNNIPLVDEFIKIINECEIMVGCDTGFTEIATYYTNVPIIIYRIASEYLRACYPSVKFYQNDNEMKYLLDEFFNQ